MTRRSADRGQVRSRSSISPSRPTSSRRLIRARAEAAAYRRRSWRRSRSRCRSPRRSRLRDEAQSRGQDPLGQPEHALRPVDARAEADPGRAARSATSCSPTSTCTRSRTGSRSCEDYDRLTLSNMSVHHLDVLRFLFGDPDEITTPTRKDPRTHLRHIRRHHRLDADAFPRACSRLSLEDVWSGPRQHGYKDDQHINWRVEGLDGVAKGTIGWPTRRGLARCITLRPRRTGGQWVAPSWETMWFPARFHRRDGAIAIRGEDRRAAGAYGRRQCEDDGAGRSGLPLDRRRPHGQTLRNPQPN